MENETKSAQPDNRERNAVHEETKVQPKSTRSSRKTILVAAMVSVVTIGTLVILRDQVGDPLSQVTTVEHGIATLDKETTKNAGVEGDGMFASENPQQNGETFDTIERLIENLSEQVGRWFESLRADHASANNELSGLANSISTIRESVAELRKSNEDLKQRIDAAQSQLQAIAKDVRGLKVAAKKKASNKRKHAAAKPPFYVDAIDLWDDAVYVAVSQEGRVAFLREGEQRSGWNVAHIDRVKGRVAFRGPAGQDYSASLGR